MRRVSAIALLFLYLSANIDFREIIRVPVMFEHFHEHRQTNRELRFIEFIILHYFGDDVGDADDERHQQLPFKGARCELPSLSLAITMEHTPVATHLTVAAVQKPVIYTSPFTSPRVQFTIWQPPRA